MDQREGSECRRLVEIDELQCQVLRASVSDFVSLAAMQEGKKGKKVEGSAGYL
jgi:hypothetical protein